MKHPILPRCKQCNRQCPIGKKLCGKCLNTANYKTVYGKPVTRGKNKRGTCLHKPDKPRTRRAKKQNVRPFPKGFMDPFNPHYIPYEERD